MKDIFQFLLLNTSVDEISDNHSLHPLFLSIILHREDYAITLFEKYKSEKKFNIPLFSFYGEQYGDVNSIFEFIIKGENYRVLDYLLQEFPAAFKAPSKAAFIQFFKTQAKHFSQEAGASRSNTNLENENKKLGSSPDRKLLLLSYSPIFNRHVFSIDMVDIASDILVAASGNSVWILGTNCKTLSIKFRCPVVILRTGGRFRGYAGRNGVAVRHVQAAIALSGGGHLFLEPILLDGPLPRLTLLLAVPGILKYPLRQGGKRQLSS